MKKLAILLAMTVTGYASDSINQINNLQTKVETNSSVEIMNNNNIINTLWNNIEYEEVKYDDQQCYSILNAAKELAINSEYLPNKKYHNIEKILNDFLDTLPNNKFLIFSKDNIISLLNNAKKLRCRDYTQDGTGVKFVKRKDCNCCGKYKNGDNIIKDFIERLNNKKYHMKYGKLNEFAKHLLKNNYIFQDIGSSNSEHNIIHGIDKMPYYNTLHILLNQIYDENQNEIICFENKVLLITKKCLLIPYLHKFLNNKNTNDLYYRITHYPNNNYNIALFFNNLSEDGNNNSLIISLTTCNNTIKCEVNAFHGLYPNKLKAYRNASKNTKSSN